jgi:general secretion pathway protein C
LETPRFSRSVILRKGTIDQVVSLSKVILIIFWLFLIALFVREILSVGALTQAAFLEIENGFANSTNISQHPIESGSTQLRDLSSLARSPLFPPAPQVSSDNPSNQKPKSPSTLSLQLVGTYLSKGTPPFAIIEHTKKKSQDVFNVGEQVYDEAKLIKITTESVHLERDGQIEELLLDIFSTAQGDANSSDSDENSYNISESELDKALENLPLLLTQARAIPYFKDGVSVGLRLFAIKSGSMFEKLGLKNGDILKAVNGNSLADITQAVKLFETLKSERSITLKLERSQEEKEFRYNIR